MRVRLNGWQRFDDRMKRLLAAVLCAMPLLCLTDCRQAEAPRPSNPAVDSAVQNREDEFRWKERCSVAAERLDKLFGPSSGARSGYETSVSEAFYSPARNSCVCEVSALGKGGKTGTVNLLTLYDCLTREDLGETLIQIGGNDFEARLDAWRRKKAAIKDTPVNGSLRGVVISQSGTDSLGWTIESYEKGVITVRHQANTYKASCNVSRSFNNASSVADSKSVVEFPTCDLPVDLVGHVVQPFLGQQRDATGRIISMWNWAVFWRSSRVGTTIRL